jgi:hypothetical protein
MHHYHYDQDGIGLISAWKLALSHTVTVSWDLQWFFFLVTLPYSCMLNLLARRVLGRLFSGMVGVVIQGGIVGKMEELGNVFVITMR